MKQDKKNRNENVLESCFFCNSYYSQNDFLMLEERDQKTVFHVTCPKCNTSALIYSSITNAGIVNMGLATDLDKKEAKRMFRDNTIDTDDILEMHEFLYNQNVKK